MIYKATDGSRWTITYEPIPVPIRGADWAWVSDDYGGPGEPGYPGDDRHGTAANEEKAREAIEQWIEENPDE